VTAAFLADVVVACCYLLGVLTVAMIFHAVVLAAFRPPDRGLDPADPKVQEMAVEQARREGRR
jgi:hypothetical protein